MSLAVITWDTSPTTKDSSLLPHKEQCIVLHNLIFTLTLNSCLSQKVWKFFNNVTGKKTLEFGSRRNRFVGQREKNKAKKGTIYRYLLQPKMFPTTGLCGGGSR